jgi:hypothetical protein
MNQADIERAKENLKKGMAELSASSSCLRCGHLKTCAIYRAIKPLMGNWPDGDDPKTKQSLRPFEAESIAQICTEYAEHFVVLPHQGGEQ